MRSCAHMLMISMQAYSLETQFCCNGCVYNKGCGYGCCNGQLYRKGSFACCPLTLSVVIPGTCRSQQVLYCGSGLLALAHLVSCSPLLLPQQPHQTAPLARTPPIRALAVALAVALPLRRLSHPHQKVQPLCCPARVVLRKWRVPSWAANWRTSWLNWLASKRRILTWNNLPATSYKPI